MRVDKTAPEMEKQLIKCDKVPQRVHCIPGERALANEGDPCVPWDVRLTRAAFPLASVRGNYQVGVWCKHHIVGWINLLRFFLTPTLVKSPLKVCFWPR